MKRGNDLNILKNRNFKMNKGGLSMYVDFSL